ncbi:unnamed protein product [Moneuplotes crassus]|uniref:Uncharacterized protein n=1 Tax=Euplotes crassus TaxID=5936 RepID=A0AAD1UFE6_EUPCR|nr:unnamed protein product [Moneuplotes crassus]
MADLNLNDSNLDSQENQEILCANPNKESLHNREASSTVIEEIFDQATKQNESLLNSRALPPRPKKKGKKSNIHKRKESRNTAMSTLVSTSFTSMKSKYKPISIRRSYATNDSDLTFKPKLGKITKCLTARRSRSQGVHDKLYKEALQSKFDRVMIPLYDTERYLNDTFQPSIKKSNDPNYYEPKSKLKGKFYDRCVSWKKRHDKWIKKAQKVQKRKLREEIKRSHVETMRYSLRSNTARSPGTCLQYSGVTSHLERQHKAQEEKALITKLKSSGIHRNHKSPPKTRVTIPSRTLFRLHLSSAMSTINAYRTCEDGQRLTSKDLASKGFTIPEIIQTASDLENSSRERIKQQFTGEDQVLRDISKEDDYLSAVQTLHKYLHSFDMY